MIKETRLANVTLHEEDDKMILEGYALVFNNETLIGDEAYGFIEEIDARALSETKMKDVPMKYNHMDSFLILARTRNKSLTLTVDSIGLKVRAELLDTHTNQDIYKMVRSGLLDKMSFAFTVDEQVWNREGSIPKRTITKIERLYDVSVVDTPAYDSTSIYARSLESMELELKAMDMVEQEEQSKLIKKRIKIKSQI
ncbi:HK97 family phage prohead protease [Hujiaoplasma nucleasis]|uniref:HK97 family phage prohead protease n=1 Tax=Hujiaoplasma nucleasis TaxID=2725268 RepID=A0A7L6N4K9_9MOLU|nr:HK97 family phage prohead protease [Hujiaoplasma nucleasis]QLY40178.1 HK97 family phage prohead protease [Hujiaoplasma nucleasis]